MDKIIPCLWFNDQAEEAATFYISVFKDGKIHEISHYAKSSEEVSGKPAGSVLTVDFEINGFRMTALNGGPQFTFSEAVSLQVFCKDQSEIDYFWEALTADGGSESACGWLKDKFGFSWQIVPENMGKFFADSAPEARERTMAAMLQMKKIVISDLEAAAQG